ncbi:class I SAM-dependent methyltransferase [Paenibacillus doosanensis]|uniref:class I SAM-dependent methyltransferase n=1 Tax=Paenibacillus doosanensis TaxID=1229154 RepID=UPI00217F6AC9|nr:class I SAM-dependent methyltransferase [Paenibacillus doosanensis]MCS7464452.1 class I SAM-dependent methyltransferase [Paenibacillus doosanensis]
MLITTSYDPQREQLELADRLAAQIKELKGGQGNVRRVRRARISLAQLCLTYDDPDILLVTRERIEYYHEQQPALFFHPSTAAIRVKRLLNGESDTLLEMAGVRPGDRILDCTAGLGSDAVTLSFAAGQSGQVTALESSPLPFLLLQQGLGEYVSDIPGMTDAMRRIRVLHEEHLDFLRRQDAKSFDVVYFDPMFRKPIHESNSIRSIRQLADARALTEEAVHEARRAARRAVVMKEHRDSGEFARLGFAELHRSTSKIAYGVIRL